VGVYSLIFLSSVARLGGSTRELARFAHGHGIFYLTPQNRKHKHQRKPIQSCIILQPPKYILLQRHDSYPSALPRDKACSSPQALTRDAYHAAHANLPSISGIDGPALKVYHDITTDSGARAPDTWPPILPQGAKPQCLDVCV
jgi:hypothetical protein